MLLLSQYILHTIMRKDGIVMAKAAESYTGDKDEKAVFDKVLTSLGKEYGLSACAIMGAGFGNTGNPNDNCFVLGMGIRICASEGASY